MVNSTVTNSIYYDLDGDTTIANAGFTSTNWSLANKDWHFLR